MSNLVGIYDHNIGENLVREMTLDEKAEREAEVEAWKAAKTKAELETKQLRETKIAAYQKLGLTEAEIEALLPTPKPLVKPSV